MRISELDDIEKELLLNRVLERPRADLNDGRPLTEMRQPNEEDYVAQLLEAGFGVVADGPAVIVTGPADRIPIDRLSGAHDLLAATRARRFESAEIAYNTLIHYPAMEAKQNRS